MKRANERIMKIKIVLGKNIVHIFSAYAPLSGENRRGETRVLEKAVG